MSWSEASVFRISELEAKETGQSVVLGIVAHPPAKWRLYVGDFGCTHQLNQPKLDPDLQAAAKLLLSMVEKRKMRTYESADKRR